MEEKKSIWRYCPQCETLIHISAATVAAADFYPEDLKTCGNCGHPLEPIEDDEDDT